MEKFIELNKRSKKAQKEYYKRKRAENGFNTGIRTMQDNKHPSRSKRKKEFKKMLDNY